MMPLIALVSTIWIALNDPSARVDAALAESAELEQDSRFEEAALRVEEVLDVAEYDYGVRLQLGWLWFNAGDYSRAALNYQRALELSGESEEARLGLAWCALRSGDRASAEAQFRTLVEEGFGDRARLGLSLAEGTPGRSTFAPSFSTTNIVYQNHLENDWAQTGVVALRYTQNTGFVVGAAYRYLQLNQLTVGLGQGSRGFDPTVQQHEGYVDVGVSKPRWGAIARGALLRTTTDADGTSTVSAEVMGSSLRFTAFADVLLDASYSFYSDFGVVGVAPRVSVPLGSHVRLIPGGSLQLYDQQRSLAGTLDLVLSYDVATFWAGARLGEEFRPVRFDEPSVYNLDETLRGGARVGIDIGIGDHGAAFAVYEWIKLRNETLDPQSVGFESDMHVTSLGVRLTL